MKYKKQISKNYSKAIALLLLLYFITSPILFALPKNICSTACPMALNNNSIEMQMNMMNGLNGGMMIKMMQSQKHHNTCDTEFGMLKCDMNKGFISSSNYIVPVKYSVNAALQPRSIFDSYVPNKNLQPFEISKIETPKKNTPIYIIIDSFLI